MYLNLTRLNDGKGKKDSIRVNLIGPQRNTPINVSFSIDPSSTAVSGFHYVLVTTGSVTIPANSSYAYIRYNVFPDNINQGEGWKVKFILTAADVKINANYSVFTRTLRISCPFSRPNFVGPYTTHEPNYGDYDNPTTAGTEANSVQVANFWDSGGAVKYLFNTDSATPTVTLPSQDVVMGGTTFVVAGTAVLGTYDPCTYQFIVPYTVRRKSDNALYDNNTHTYTHK